MIKEERKNWQAEMFALIRKWQGSGLSQKEFFSQHDLAPHLFYYWLKKYNTSQGSSNNSFLQVEVESPKEESREEVQVHYPNGVMISLSSSVSISRLRALIKAV